MLLISIARLTTASTCRQRVSTSRRRVSARSAAQPIVGIIRVRVPIDLRYSPVGDEQIAAAVLVLAGPVPAQVALAGRPVLEWVLSALASLPAVGEIMVAPQVEMHEWTPVSLRPPVRWCPPHTARLGAIREALQSAGPSARVLVHD